MRDAAVLEIYRLLDIHKGVLCYSLSLWTASIGPFMILSWQLDGAGWLISIISFMILILAARWRRKPKAQSKEFCPHSARIRQLTQGVPIDMDGSDWAIHDSYPGS